jgi:hypothetical protein
MRRILLVSLILLTALCVASVAQQAARPANTAVNASQLRAVRLPTELEATHLRIAQQRSIAAREQLNGIRARLKLPPLDVTAINRTKVPVLAVLRGAQFANQRIRTTIDHMVVSAGDDRRGFVLTGTRLASTVARPETFRVLKPDDDKLLKSVLTARGVVDPISDVEVSKTEDGYDISFRRYGAVYNLRLSCADTEAPDCTKEEALKLLADTQVLGGGQ